MSSVRQGDARPAVDAVTGPAWRILAAAVGVGGLVVVGAFGCLAAAAHLVATGRLLHLATLLLTLLAVVSCWSLVSVLRAPLPRMPGVPLDRGSAPELLDLVDATASALRVAPPAEVLLGLGCDVQVVHRDQRLAMVVGAPLVWGLPAAVLAGMLAPVLATVPEARLPLVRRARAVAARLDQAPLDGLITAPLLRPLRALCRRASADLDRRSERAAAGRIGPALVGPPLHVLDVETAWDFVIEEFAVPAWARGWRPSRLCAALVDLVGGSEQAWRPSGPDPARPGLVSAAERLDREVSELMAREVWRGRLGQPVEWPDYAELVLGPARREQAVRLLAAVDRVYGAPGPATPLRVLDALDEGVAPAVIAVLSPRSGGGGPGQFPEDVLGAALAALVECAVESSGLGRIAVSWRTGPVLLGNDGHPLRGVQRACDDAAWGATEPLRTALVDLGVPPGEPVWLAGDEPPDIGTRAIAALPDIWHRGRLYDLILCEEHLVLLVMAGRGLDVRGAAEFFAGDRARDDVRLRAILAGDVDAAAARSPHTVVVPLSDVIDVRLRVVLWQLAWRMVVRTADRRLVLRNGRNPSTFRALRDLLAPALGDRLRVRGFG